MSFSNAQRARGERGNSYQEVTDKIISELEQGRFPWVQPWGAASANLGLPQNAATARRYSGINILLLWGATAEKGYRGQNWLTFRQALTLGGCVRRGEKGITVFYADRFIPKSELERAQKAGDDPNAVAFLKRFTVFNVAQCDDLPDRLTATAPPADPDLIQPRVRALIQATGIDFRIGGDRAFYAPADDYVCVPPPQAYFEPINWHRTALHELGHASGHASRLNRDLSGAFDTKKRAFEELIAEMNAAFCCAALGIVPTVRHADYLASWLKVLKEDSGAIFRAASQASKAADYILAFDVGTQAQSEAA